MLTAIQKKIWQHTFDVAHLFKQNAAIVHGLPEPGPISLDDVPVETEAGPPGPFGPQGPPGPSGPIGPQGPSISQSVPPVAKSNGWTKAAVVAGALTAGTLGGIGLTSLLTPDEKPPATTPPASQPKDDGSLLQWLEDTGKHIAPNGDVSE